MKTFKNHYSTERATLTAVPLAVLIVSLYYIVAFTLLPDPGITLDSRGGDGWMVVDVNECGWCGDVIQPGDLLLRIDEIYMEGRARPLFWGVGHNNLTIERQRDGVVEIVEVSFFGQIQYTRLLLVVYPLFFWLPAAFIWYFAERTLKRQLMAGTFFVYAIWVAAGTVSTSLVGGSSLIVHALSWVLLPLAVQMHWCVPEPLSTTNNRFWRGFYTVGLAAALLEIFHFLPDGLFLVPLALQIMVGAGVVFWRLAQSRTETAVLMAAGQGIAFGPALVWVALVTVAPEMNGFMLVAAVTISLSAFPLLYTYANYKQFLGQKEAGLRRTTAALIYLMLCFDVTVATAMLLGGRVGWSADVISRHTAFIFLAVVMAVWFYRRFEDAFLRLLDGRVDTAVSGALSLFSERMTDALNTNALHELLHEVGQILKANKLALYLLGDEGYELRFSYGETAVPKPLDVVMTSNGGGVNLPLYVRQKQIGLLVVGRHTKGGLYSPHHLRRLQNLANNIAAVMEIIQQREMLEYQRGMIVRQEKMASLGRMAASLAHQVNNPLQVIQGSLEAFSGYADGGPDDRWLSAAYRETQFLARVVSSITKFAHPTLGNDDFTWLDVNEAVHEALLLAGEKIKQNSIVLNLSLGDQVGAVRMMPTDLTQVISLLIDNACDAMPDGGRLTIKTGMLYGKGANSTVEISDTGNGVAQEEQAHLFEPFYTTKPKGHGFGLSIAYSIIERSNGNINLQSEEGKGSTFTIKLPALC